MINDLMLIRATLDSVLTGTFTGEDILAALEVVDAHIAQLEMAAQPEVASDDVEA